MPVPSTAKLSPDIIDAFAATLRGDLVLPDTSDYDATRAVWNAMIDRRPALVARLVKIGTDDFFCIIRHLIARLAELFCRPFAKQFVTTSLSFELKLRIMRKLLLKRITQFGW